MPPIDAQNCSFADAVAGLRAGDFSRLAPLFEEPRSDKAELCRIVEWYQANLFASEPKALAEALTCACFLGKTRVVAYLLDHGVDPLAGIGTGLNSFHWAANRGQLEIVRLLLSHHVPLEARSMYDGTVLGTATWSAVHEPRPDHLKIIEALLAAGAKVNEAEFPSGDERVDRLLKRHHEARNNA
jgi:Ankyrin repeats (3 copies)